MATGNTGLTNWREAVVNEAVNRKLLSYAIQRKKGQPEGWP
jgi:hypothetical protein